MMRRIAWQRSTVEAAAIAIAVLACVAFIASFVFGLRTAAEPDPDGTAPAAVIAGPDSAAGRVEVLNASGRSGIARHVTWLLRDDGFDVVFFGNAPASAGDRSVVLARSGRADVAADVARALDIDSVRTQPDSSLFLDATAIIGTDWSPSVGTPPEPVRGWRRALDWIRPGR